MTTSNQTAPRRGLLSIAALLVLGVSLLGGVSMADAADYRSRDEGCIRSYQYRSGTYYWAATGAAQHATWPAHLCSPGGSHYSANIGWYAGYDTEGTPFCHGWYAQDTDTHYAQASTRVYRGQVCSGHTGPVSVDAWKFPGH